VGSLSIEQREALLFNRADVIGGMDGIPAVVRDRANRSILPGMTEQVREQVALLADKPQRTPAEQDQLDKLKDAKLISDYSRPKFVLAGWKPALEFGHIGGEPVPGSGLCRKPCRTGTGLDLQNLLRMATIRLRNSRPGLVSTRARSAFCWYG